MFRYDGRIVFDVVVVVVVVVVVDVVVVVVVVVVVYPTDYATVMTMSTRTTLI